MDDDTSTDADETGTNPGGPLRHAVNYGVEGARATSVVVASVVLVVGLAVGAAVYAPEHLGTLSDSVYVIGVSFLVTLLLWIACALVFVFLMVCCSLVVRGMSLKPANVEPSPPPVSLKLTNLLSLLLGGTGGGIVCLRLAQQNPLQNICGLGIVLTAFWALAQWQRSRTRGSVADPSHEKPTATLSETAIMLGLQLTGVAIGGLIQSLGQF